MAVATISSAAAGVLSGQVRAGFRGVEGASVYLYATGNTGYKSASTRLSSETPALTDDAGNFSISRDQACPDTTAELYLIAVGGDSGDGFNSRQVLLSPVGPCSALNSRSGLVINEVTTVASTYALAAFMSDSEHVGVAPTNEVGLANAFNMVSDLVDLETGQARLVTRDGTGIVPQAKLNTLANALDACASAANELAGPSCAKLLSLIPSANAPATSVDTLRAVLAIATNAATLAETTSGSSTIYQLAAEGPFVPALQSRPLDWTLAIQYPHRSSLIGDSPGRTSAMVDASGNLWSFDKKNGTAIEYLGVVSPNAGPSHPDRNEE
jgi:hypothetical protein